MVKSDNKDAHPVDAYVGNRLRQLRKKHMLSQARLASMVGLSHQQIQQYEIGANRVAASTLYDFSNILNVPVAYFYEGYVPSRCAEPHEEVVRAISMKRTSPLAILLIEDDAADEVLARNALESCRLETRVHAVHDGIEALEFLRNKRHINSFPRPDLVLLDLNIPKMDGYSVLKEIKNDREVRDIPVVVLTNSINLQEMLDAYRAGASGFYVKSFDVEEFNHYIDVLVQYWSTVALPSMQ